MSLSKSIRVFFFLVVLPLGTESAGAAEYKGISYSVEPIVGYELQRKSDPERSKLVLTYGARIVAGYQILSAEGEYTQGKSDELFASTGTRIEEQSEKVRLGLRSTYSLGSMLDWFLRGGAEAQKIKRTTTVSGVATTNHSPSRVYPYVGTGISISLGPQFSLNGGITATLKDLNDLKQTEYTTTFGIKVALNTGK